MSESKRAFCENPECKTPYCAGCESKFTTGPWITDSVGRQEHGAIGVFAEAGVACVALVQPGCLAENGREDAARANARLIAAAPEMLDVLGMVLRAFNVDEVDPLIAFATVEKVKVAIAKATDKGESK